MKMIEYADLNRTACLLTERSVCSAAGITSEELRNFIESGKVTSYADRLAGRYFSFQAVREAQKAKRSQKHTKAETESLRRKLKQRTADLIK